MLTVVVAIDNEHIEELQKTLPTWIKYKGFDKYPFLVIYDAAQLHPDDDRFEMFKNLNVEYVAFKDPLDAYHTQREKMLTALTVLPGKHVKTQWYLKIDTDCTALDGQKWFDETWLEKNYVFISNPWGITKPANAIKLLDDWAIEKFPGIKPLNIPFNMEDGKVRHKRIISWLFLCKTSWSAVMAEHFNHDGIYKLPSISDTEYRVSQDTILWYLAELHGYDYKLFHFKDKGWKHSRV